MPSPALPQHETHGGGNMKEAYITEARGSLASVRYDYEKLLLLVSPLRFHVILNVCQWCTEEHMLTVRYHSK